jgi:hypothetical protein
MNLSVDCRGEISSSNWRLSSIDETLKETSPEEFLFKSRKVSLHEKFSLIDLIKWILLEKPWEKSKDEFQLGLKFIPLMEWQQAFVVMKILDFLLLHGIIDP